MEREILAYIKQNRMIGKNDVVLAGVSGGSDSMAMLRILKELQGKLDFTLRVVHIHHGIRGKEADRDRSFVENICRKWQIPCTVYCYDVPGLSREWKLGEEETGRIVRKEAFQREAAVCGRKDSEIKIALAHNQEDLAETMLHNLCRGTGLRGLCTMRPVDGEIIRPILCLNRDKIAEYLKEKKISHIQDSTNLSDEYTRNRIRHHVLPAMENEINSRTVEHMAETARVLAAADDYFGKKGQELLDQCKAEDGYLLDREFFEKDPIIQEYAVLEAFGRLAGKRKDYTSLHVEQVLSLQKKENGRYTEFPQKIRAVKEYGGVRLRKISPQQEKKHRETEDLSGFFREIPVPGTLESPFGIFEAKIFFYKNQKIEENKYTKWFDYDKIKNSPCVRTRRQGDFLVVNREGGRKKLNRVFIDEKIPASLRDKLPVVATDSEILWIPGGRMNEQYKITSTTGRVLELHYQGGVLT